LLSEIQNLRRINHPNIVTLYEVFSDNNYAHLIMENCTGGELLSKLSKEKTFSELKAAVYMK
jgi:calcium-dependent protein kinase